jgi:glycosyltransferase involved in cell wall biosynthesis
MPLPTRARRSATAAAGDPRSPNLFIVGAPKAGTTFVHHALELAPDVYMSPVKEPGFFTSEREQRRGLSYYLDAYFARAARFALRGESTPWYLYSEMARESIAALPNAEDARFVVLVRRPAARAHSMYLDQVRLNREPRTFEVAVAEELAALERGELCPDVRQRYVWGGLYSDHIERWRQRFGADRVHVVVFDEMVATPARVWAELGEFLGRDLGPSRFDQVSDRDRNKSGRLRWPRMDAFLRSFEGREHPVIEAAKRVLPPGLHRRVLQRIGRLNRTPTEDVDDVEHTASLQALDEYYRPEVARLETLVGKPLLEWWAADEGTAGAGGSPSPASLSEDFDGRLRIVHLVARSQRRGAEIVAVELADELDRLGYSNRVVALGPATSGGHEVGLMPLADSQGVGLVDLIVRVRRVRRLLADAPADVVLAHGGWAAQIAALAVRRAGPVLVWQRIQGFPSEVWQPLRQRWWRAVARRFDVVVALTPDLEAEMHRLRFEGPIWAIPNSRQPDRFLALDRAAATVALRAEVGARDGEPLVGFVGHLVAVKRPERTLDVVDRLRARGCPVHLVVAGDGPLRASLEEEAKARGLEGAVSFLGHCRDVERVFGGVELALLTSETEGIPGVAIEALMAGCPLVSFPVGGVRAVVDDGITGVVLARHDPELMADAVAALLADPDRRSRMSEEGRLRTGRFSASVTAELYADGLAAVVAAR